MDTPQQPHRLGPERGYAVPQKRATTGTTLDAFRRAAERVAGPDKFSYKSTRPGVSESRPGFITIRVPRRRPDGSQMDSSEARETLRGEPWFAEVQHRGTTNRYHLFDRPDTELARKVRNTSNADPLAALSDAVASLKE
jgi:hypothetical protein